MNRRLDQRARIFSVLLTLLLLPALAAAVPAPPERDSAEEASPLFAQARGSAERDGYTLITTPALKRILDENPNVLLVDVRFAYEFAAGHMPEAVSLPVDLRDRGDLSPERRRAMVDTFGPDKERTIVLYCRDFR
ncbi:hypothetical protein JCM31598_37320 [Desulfonatronum parangueonense]